jgi:hypothetical protein
MANFFGMLCAKQESSSGAIHSPCGGLWNGVFRECFMRDHSFTVEAECMIFTTGERSDIAIVDIDSQSASSWK